MELTIKKKTESPLLSRTRVTAEATYQGPTPTESAVKDSLASKLSVDKNLVSVRHVYTRFGKQFAKIIAHVYDNKKDMDLYEVKTKKQRKTEEEAAKKAADEAAKPAAEKSAEQTAEKTEGEQ